MCDYDKILAVVLTYGDRKRLLESVISRLQELAGLRILVVSNGAVGENAAYIRSLSTAERVQVIELAKNMGSATGYSIGLKAAMALKELPNFIWLLDDDNRPRKDALSRLLELYSDQENGFSELFFAHRTDRVAQSKSFESGICHDYSKDSFLGYSIFRKHRLNDLIGKKLLPVDVAPYGGMLLPLSAVKKAGFPNDSYFLYADDYEYSLRMRDLGYRMRVVMDACVDDMEHSWHVSQRGSAIFGDAVNMMRMYYAVRNGVYTDLQRIDNRIIFCVNFFYFLLIQVGKEIRVGHLGFLRISRLRVFFVAIKDACKGNLGIRGGMN